MAHRLSPEAKPSLTASGTTSRLQAAALRLPTVSSTLTQRFYLLPTNPHLGRRRDHDLRSGMRSFSVGEYLILYRIDEQDALILRVVRGSRNIEAHFGGDR